jgi:hypothetical protein
LDRTEAYAILAGELERMRLLPFDDLACRAGAPPSVTSIPAGSETLEIEVRVAWADARRGILRIEAAARGPSCWRLERLEKSIVVSEPEPGLADA